MALDAALSYSVDIGGVFASYGQVYSMTPVRRERCALRVGAFTGAGDKTIGPELALLSYGRLFRSGCGVPRRDPPFRWVSSVFVCVCARTDAEVVCLFAG